MPQDITSRDNERVKFACKLAADPAFRAQQGLFFAEGARLCLDLAVTLKARAVFCTDDMLRACPEAANLAPESYRVSQGVAEKLSATKTPQGLFCLFEMPHFTVEDMDPAAGILVCEALRDPANVGAVMRSAAGLGFGGVVLLAGCADPTNPKALRASMGAVGRIPWVVSAGLAETAAWLRGAGCRLYAAALAGAVPAGQAMPQGPFALLVGNEAAGLTEEALAACDARVCIPMRRGVESLNAAVAASVLMYAFTAGRQA